ncbi:hypothetical protein Tco_0176288, partial [Tanacetum coccineum]
MNVPENEYAPAPEYAPIARNPALIQHNDYLANDEEDPEEEPKKEEEPIPEQAPAAPIKEDDGDEVEAEEEDEEEMEDEEEEEMEVKDNDGENDDDEVYNLYKEADPLNRPPPSPETAEQEIMNALVTRSTLQPIPPIRVKTLTKQMWDRFRVKSSSSKRLERNDMRMNSFDDDLTALDSTFREQMQEMKKLVAGL